MSTINIKRQADKKQLEQDGVMDWPIWEKEVSNFPWTYESDEHCYILEGRVTVTPDNANSVEIKAGDYVIFPKGMSCTWEIHEPIRKHYQFS